MSIKSLSKSALAFLFAFAMLSGLTSCSSDETRYIPVKLSSDGNWSMLDVTNGKLVFTDEFKEEPTVVSEDIFSVMEGEHVVLYKNGKKPKAIDTEGLTGAGLCKEGLIPVAVKKERMQVLDASGNKKFELSPIGGKEITHSNPFFTEGWLLVGLENGENTFVDKKGKPMGKTFEYASCFYKGYAVVREKSKDSEKGESQYSIIDTKGETVLKYKPGWTAEFYVVIDGKTIIKNANNVYCVLDLKGEVTKLPASVSEVSDFRHGMIIFQREGEWGVMKEDGEILIRPKYTSLTMISSDRLLAQKSSNAWVMLDKKGEEIFTTDEYESMAPIGKSLLGKGKTTSNLLDEKGKLLSKEDFFEVGFSIEAGELKNNYFNSEEVADAVVKNVEASLAQYKLGDSAAQIMQKVKDAKEINGYTWEPEDMLKFGYQWTIAGRLYFSTYISTYNLETSARELNSNALLQEEVFGVFLPEEHCDAVYESLKKAFVGKGYKETVPADGIKQGNLTILSSAKNKIYMSKEDGRISLTVTPAEEIAFQTGNDIMNPADQINSEGGPEGNAASTTSSSSSPASANGNDFAWLSQREVTAADLKGLDKSQCRILRNAIFARHGYKFKSKDLTDYFSQFSWYKPQYTDVNSQLSAIERQNIEFIKRYE